MMAERNAHLENNPVDKGNGSYQRKLGTPMGQLDLIVPRDRDGDFRPSVLPKQYNRDFAEREDLIMSLFINGYSPNQINKTLTSMHLHYNPEEIETLKNNYLELYNQWQNRELPCDVAGLFIDAYHCHTLIEQKVKKSVVFVIIGIDFTGCKSLYGIYIYTGNESKGFWLTVLNQIINRGVKSPLYIVSDDLAGLKDAINTLFPLAFHQLCYVHMHRNAHRNMSKEDACSFNEEMKKIKDYKTFEKATETFIKLCALYQEKYPEYVKALLADTNNYFAFMKLPKGARKYFYTTNIVESFNSILESSRQKSGGFFQSQDFLKVNIYINILNLSNRVWKKGIPLLKANLYEVRQLFATQYGRLPVASDLDNNELSDISKQKKNK